MQKTGPNCGLKSTRHTARLAPSHVLSRGRASSLPWTLAGHRNKGNRKIMLQSESLLATRNFHLSDTKPDMLARSWQQSHKTAVFKAEIKIKTPSKSPTSDGCRFFPYFVQSAKHRSHQGSLRPLRPTCRPHSHPGRGTRPPPHLPCWGASGPHGEKRGHTSLLHTDTEYQLNSVSPR